MDIPTISSENELFNDFEGDYDWLSTDFLGDEYEKSLLPSLADKIQVGFLSSDQATQTDKSEILDIKQMTDTMQLLVSELGRLKRDLQFARQVLKATFEEKLQNKAYDLHAKLNDRLRDLQKVHEERVTVIRRSFKQQLQDALVKMAAHYKKFYETKLGTRISTKDTPATKKRLKNMEAELERKNSVIHMLEVQIEKLRADLAAKANLAETKVDAKEVDALRDQIMQLNSDINKLNEKVDDLTMAVDFRDEKIKQLGLEMAEKNAEADTERDMSRKFARQIEELKKQIDIEKLNASEELDRQKQAMERDMASKMASNEADMAIAARERAKFKEQLEAEMQAKLLEERKMFEMKLAQEREEARQRERSSENAKNLDRLVIQQQQEILILKKRLASCQKQWEQKFAVLRASLHALKDESYVRLQLQKQAASLKYASISYGTEAPPPTSHMASMFAAGAVQQQPLKPPRLPVIKRGKKEVDAQQTNTLPSGVGTDPFSGDEGDGEVEIVEGFIPLPPKPNVGDYMPTINSTS